MNQWILEEWQILADGGVFLFLVGMLVYLMLCVRMQKQKNDEIYQRLSNLEPVGRKSGGEKG